MPDTFAGARNAINPIMHDVSLITEKITEPEHISEFNLNSSALPIDNVEEIVNKVSPCENPTNTDYNRVMVTNFPKVDTVVKLNANIGLSETFVESKKRFKVPMRGREIKNDDNNNQLNTYIIRNALEHYKITDTQHEELFKCMKNEFLKYYKPTEIDLDDLISVCFAEQIDKINVKGEKDQAQIFDPTDFLHSHEIKVFLKSQIKADHSANSWFKTDANGNYKAGQGISAQPKSVNLLVGALVRALSAIMSRSFHKFIPCYGKHPTRLRQQLESMLNDEEEFNVYSFDITQFDTLHGKWSTDFMHFLFSHIGIDSWLIDLMDDLNDVWKLKSDVVQMMVKGHLQSGRSDTLDKNSLSALFLTLANTEIYGLKTILYQGDDVTIIAKRVDLTPMSFLNTSFKLEQGIVGPAVGYLVANTLTIDLIQMTIKLCNRNYGKTTNTFFEISEYQNAIKDRLTLVSNNQLIYICLVYNSLYYDITMEEAEVLYTFCNNFAHLPPKEINTHLNTFMTHNFVINN